MRFSGLISVVRYIQAITVSCFLTVKSLQARGNGDMLTEWSGFLLNLI